MLTIKEIIHLTRIGRDYAGEAQRNVFAFFSLFGRTLEDYELVRTYKGIPVYYEPEVLYSSGLFMAAVIFGEDGTQHILVDTAFMHSSKEMQEVLLAHEVGHTIYPPNLEAISQAKRLELAGEGVLYKHEVEADNYAVKMVGEKETIRTLKRCKWLIITSEFFAKRKGGVFKDGIFGETLSPALKELDLRIKYIKKGGEVFEH